jgi:hypothetical protein
MIPRCRFWLTLGIVTATLASIQPATPLFAEEKADPKGIEFFETKIRPVLVAQCYECHSAKASKVRGGLVLDTRAGIRKGGDNGPAVVPGDLEGSLLIKAIKHEDMVMPPKEKGKLSDKVIADFVQWVKMGAPDPREGTTAGYKTMTFEEAKTFWAYQPPAKPALPAANNPSWPKNDIDRFVLAKLQEKKLTPVADADRHTVIRRLYFDLIGLPPSPEEVEAFVKDGSANAFEKVVDKLLQSPQFGERWGRHWLDMARFAESNGNADNTPFPHAWKYRNYVIDAFNKDKPYDQFVREQIAGDLLEAKDEKEKDEFLIATGLLALTSKPRPQNNPDYRLDLIADQIDVMTRGVLGLSVMCARCHDHKFDAIPTKEYYALAGFFDSTEMMPGPGGNAMMAVAGGFVTLSDGGLAMGVREGRPTDTAIAIRGDSTKRGERVDRGFLTVASNGKVPEINRQTSGRRQLAEWLTQPTNPLTARVAANRIWMHLFGQGIVRSIDNFGALGEKPTHPELLDWLAAKFVEDGWSTKRLIKTIVMSRSYQLGSSHDAANFQIDAMNHYLWRMGPHRLDAEAIRDAILTASGKIDLTRPAGSMAPVDGPVKKKMAYIVRDSNHRSVYLGVVRGAPLPELLSMFDVANPNLVVGQREVTTVPAQALYLLNNTWVVDQSKHMARRLLSPENMDDTARVDLAFRLAFARPATAGEKERSLAFVRDAAAGLGGDGKKDEAWASLCQALFASAEFRYIE